MKYSVGGKLRIADGSDVMEIINNYQLWRQPTINEYIDRITQEQTFGFEVLLNTVEDKDSLFELLKPFVDSNGESIDWHECTHDEEISHPCVIAETYRGG